MNGKRELGMFLMVINDIFSSLICFWLSYQYKWNRIINKQNARWQHYYRLKEVLLFVFAKNIDI